MHTVFLLQLRVHYINETLSGKHLMKLFVDSFWQRDDQGHGKFYVEAISVDWGGNGGKIHIIK